MSPEQDASWQDYLNHRRRGLSLVGSRDEINRMLLAVDAELRDLRAALAASQTREATLREALEMARGYIQPRLRYVADRGFEAHGLSIASLLDDPSPASDALGRVARAGVAYRALLLPNASEVDAEIIRRHHAFKAAVDELLAVAPHWGEPQGEG